MPTQRILLFLLLFFPLAACSSPTSEPEPPTEPEKIEPLIWSVHMIQNGGEISTHRAITVDNSGQVTAVDEFSGRRGSLALSVSELDEIHALAAQSARVVPPAQATGCADCFEFELIVEIDEGPRTVRVDDLRLADSGLDPLVSSLLRLMDQALSR
jgi:hypothetical protein